MAYCLDSAVTEFGWWVEEQLDKVEGKTAKSAKAKKVAKLRALLADRAQFADPAALFKKGN